MELAWLTSYEIPDRFLSDRTLAGAIDRPVEPGAILISSVASVLQDVVSILESDGS